MYVRRGLPPAIVTSTIVLILCAVAWGALGVVSFTPAQELTTETQRFLCSVLATLTLCASMIHLSARIMRAVEGVTVDPDAYAEGYRDGLDARPAAPVSPAVSRLVRTSR